MIKLWKEVVPEVAKELNVSEEYVIEQINKYTKTLATSVNNMTHPEYDFFYLGKLCVKYKKLKRSIDYLPNKTYWRYQTYKNVLSKIELLFSKGGRSSIRKL